MKPGTGRLQQLDGLRGIAALVVVVHHCVLVSPQLARLYEEHPEPPTGAAALLGYTPLHLLWDGPAAVTVFFVLSGFVLAIPFLKPGHMPWRLYYPRRLARLYLPTIAAVALALLLFVVFPRRHETSWSWWVNAHAFPLGPVQVLKDAVLLFGTSWLDSPLWSLRWEVVFSLALPAYLFLAKRLERFWLPTLGALLALHVLGLVLENGYLRYLPVFGVGVIMAVRRERLDEIARALPRTTWIMLTVLALLLVNAPWLPFALPGARALPMVGATLVVFVFHSWDAAKRFAGRRVVQWLGIVSFSLYLIHEPIAVSLAELVSTVNPLVAVALGVPVSLGAAHLFHRFAERPTHRLAKRIGAKPAAEAAAA